MHIKFSEIPNYLHNTELYMSFIENETDEDFEIEVDVVPPEDPEVNDIEKFKIMFYVYDRWGENYDNSFLNFMDNNKLEVLVFLKGIENQFISAKMLLEKLLWVYIPVLTRNKIGTIIGRIHQNENDAVEELKELIFKHRLLDEDYFIDNHSDFIHSDKKGYDPIYDVTDEKIEEFIESHEKFLEHVKSFINNDYETLIKYCGILSYEFYGGNSKNKMNYGEFCWTFNIEKRKLF